MGNNKRKGFIKEEEGGVGSGDNKRRRGGGDTEAEEGELKSMLREQIIKMTNQRGREKTC